MHEKEIVGVVFCPIHQCDCNVIKGKRYLYHTSPSGAVNLSGKPYQDWLKQNMRPLNAEPETPEETPTSPETTEPEKPEAIPESHPEKGEEEGSLSNWLM